MSGHFHPTGFCLAVAAGMLSSSIAGETGAAYECRWADSPITIDGVADDEAWKIAKVIDGFKLPWLKEGPKPATTKTRARLLWDRENLYFFAEMEDADLLGNETKQDGEIWKDDVFELFFKPAADKPGYYEFEINVHGAVLDMFLPDRSSDGYFKHKSNGKFGIERKVVLNGTLNESEDDDKGWSVEGRIPWRDFARTGGEPEPGETWTFALCRYDYGKAFEKGKELSSSAPLTAADFHRFEDYAPIRFLGAGTNLPKRLQQVGAAATSKVKGSPEPPLPYRAERIWPELQISNLVTFNFEPGKKTLLYIDQVPWQPKENISRLRRFDPETGESETLLELSQLIYSLTFHPDFEKNGYLYMGCNGPNWIPRPDRGTRITRFEMDRETGQVDPESALSIIDWKSQGHDGAATAFGNDGLMFVTIGDGTSDSDDNVYGQRMDVLHAKVLRIDVDHPDPGKTYSVPEDNPFVDHPGARPETWAYGLRNPWRIFFDKPTGHLWVGQNGQDLTEQVYFVRKGDNYGWSVYEGSRPFYLERKLGPTPHVLPTFEHGHHESRSLTGGVVYRGEKLPELEGAYIYGDNTTGKIWAGRHNGEMVTWHQEIADTPFAITDFRESPDGELLVSDYQSKDQSGIYRLVPNPPDPDAPPFPMKLSETGLFRSVGKHVVEPTLLPYEVIAEQWTDGAEKDRFVALPGENPHMTLTKRNAWQFPDGAVLMQSLALPIDDTDSTKKKWIETRLMLKQQGEWDFFTYAWNDAGTDAELVPKDGWDTEFAIKTPGGQRTQPWRYASRAECGNCHSRAGTFVLGLQTAQLNREVDYGDGFTANQVEVMAKLGLFQNRRRKARSAPGQRESPAMTKLADVKSDTLDALANPHDSSAPVEDRARAYLQSNCSHCHVGSGGGNAQMILRYFTPRDQMGVFDAVPLHGDRGLGGDTRIISPGNPGKSVMVPRVSSRGQGQMPPIGTQLPDPQWVTLLIQWIAEMPAEN